jgi:hypothetical protein
VVSTRLQIGDASDLSIAALHLGFHVVWPGCTSSCPRNRSGVHSLLLYRSFAAKPIRKHEHTQHVTVEQINMEVVCASWCFPLYTVRPAFATTSDMNNLMIL